MKMIKCLYICSLLALLLIGACSDSTKPESVSVWLGEADPNPIHIGESTTIPYQIMGQEDTELLILNSIGQEVWYITVSSDNNQIVWNGMDRHGRQCAEGVYYYRLGYHGEYRIKSLIMIK